MTAMHNAAKKPRRPCGWCGVPTTSPDAVCSGCITTDRHSRETPTARDGLTDGNWRFDPFRRVQVWVPNERPEVACPRCLCLPHQTCRSKSGRRTVAHAERTIPQTCICGAELVGRRRVCDGCRVEPYKFQGAA